MVIIITDLFLWQRLCIMQHWARNATFIVIAQNNHWSLQNMGSFPTVLWMMATRAIVFFHFCCFKKHFLQCFDAVSWVAGGHPAYKKWVMGCWHGYLSGVTCRLAYGLADATATRCQIGFTFLVLAHLGSPRKRAVKWVCVRVALKTSCCILNGFLCMRANKMNIFIWNGRHIP